MSIVYAAILLYKPSSSQVLHQFFLKDAITSSHHITNGTAQPASVMVRFLRVRLAGYSSKKRGDIIPK
jgi:hypothetical protein